MTNMKRVFVATALSAVGAMSTMAGSQSAVHLTTNAKVEELHPFTHLVALPDGADLSSIKFERVKLVKVATQKKSTLDASQCEDPAYREPGGSIRCSSFAVPSTSPAYEVTYSYRGQTMPSDESGSNYFRFSVYFREDEVSPAIRKTLSEHPKAKTVADFFVLTTNRDQVKRMVIDEAASTFCEGNFVDGSWTRTDPKCGDTVISKATTGPSNYVTVKVDPAPGGVAAIR